MIRKDNGSNNSLFLSCQMELSDGAFFMIKHTPFPNENYPILNPICQVGVADTLGPWLKTFGNLLIYKLTLMCQQALKVSSPFLQWVIVEEILVSQRKFKLCTHEKVKSKARRLSSWVEIVMDELQKNQNFHFDLQIHPTLVNSTYLHCQMTGFIPIRVQNFQNVE